MGIEPATFRILVQFLNQLYHRVQYQYVAYIYCRMENYCS